VIVAITGAGGAIGRRLTARLAEVHDLVLIDSVAPENASVYDPTSPGVRRAAPIVPDWPYHQVDILELDGLVSALSQVDAVVHLAGSPTGEWDNAIEIMRVNALGTMSVHEAARRSSVRRVVTASSINAFGSFFWRVSDEPPVRERLPLAEDEGRIPEDPYSLSKGVAEDIGATYSRAFGMETVALRFAGVWSPERYETAVTSGLPQTTAWADDLFQWVHVDDVVDGLALSLTAPFTEPFSAAGAITLSAADTKAPEPTLELIRRYRPELETHLREELPGRASLLSIARARSVLGYAPRFALAGQD
jgi:UDP-glucose 4-epimerase